jgi:hypothetical protein
MAGGLSMSSRAEITARFARAYATVSKADRGQILDQVMEVDNRQLTPISRAFLT